MCRPRACRFYLLLVALCCLGGCRIGVPIHVWQPAQLESTAGRRVLVSTVGSNDEVADQIKLSFIQTAPRDAGRESTLVDASSMPSESGVELASAVTESSSDLALASIARSRGMDYVLSGEVLEDRGSPAEKPEGPLKVSWRLVSLADRRPVGGKPVVVDVDSAIERYPDLSEIDDPRQLLATAAAREAHRLIAPSVERDHVELAVAYLMPGSKEVRRGNLAALAGRWGEAEIIWSDVLEKHPSQVAALHNLAMAAAAGQDFSRARKLARRAVRLRPIELHKETLVWIELKQRQFHDAFGLPDPPEGWFITQGGAADKVIQPPESTLIEPGPKVSDQSMNRQPLSRR